LFADIYEKGKGKRKKGKRREQRAAGVFFHAEKEL